MNSAGIDKARGFIRASKFAEAESILKDILQETPDSAAALQQFGNLFYMQGKFEVAAIYFRKVLLLDHGDETAHYSLALALEALKRFDEALLHARQSLMRNPSRVGAQKLEKRLIACIAGQPELVEHEVHIDT